MGQQAGPAGPGTPTPQTGSPWEQNMIQRLSMSNPDDTALQQALMRRQAQAGQGPQFQGTGRPDWQTVSGAWNPQGMMGVGQAMGSLPTDAMGGNPGNAPARQAGYAAYKPGAMGQLARAMPDKVKPAEQTQWMARK